MTKFFAIAFAATLIACVDARMIRMRSGSSCHCRHRIQNERDDAIKKHNDVANDIDVLKAFVTTSSCKPGYEFNYDNSKLDKKAIVCDKCPENYYRATENTTCIHCPEGYVSKEGSSICTRATDTDLKHSLCPIGSVVGNNPFAEIRKSCRKCDKNSREYMPYLNNADDCLICPIGSIIDRNNECSKCPIGYYEHNNKCVECDAGSYNDMEGASQCMECKNIKSTSFNIMGGTTCDDSALFDIAKKLNSYIDLSDMSNPIIGGMQFGSAIIYNNRRIIKELSVFGGVIGVGVAALVSG